MAFIGIKIHHETARLLASLDVPGDKIPADQMHVTLVYLGKEVPIRQITKAIAAVYKVTSEQTPFLLQTSKATCFPSNEDGVPIIAKITSQDLLDFRAKLCKELDAANVEYSKRFPDYKPHVTLSYHDEEIKNLPLAEPLRWGVNECVLWAGDAGDDRMTINFPFVLKQRSGRNSSKPNRK